MRTKPIRAARLSDIGWQGWMALRLLRRDVGLRPADHLTAAYNALLAGVWVTLLHRTPYALWLFVAHASAAAMPWLVARGERRLSPFGRALREIYPLLWLLPFWIELDFLRHLLHQATFDASIVALDRVVFGAQIDAVWISNLDAVWFSEVMHALYIAYYPAIVLPLLYMVIAGTAEMQRDAVFRMMLVYLSCFVVYIAFPVDGPHYLRPRYDGALTDALFYRLVSAVQGAGDSQGCSFPSSHVAAMVTMAYLGRRWFSGWTAGILGVAAAGVAVSAVYTQNHYAIDSLAGVAWALGLQLLIVPVLLRWRRARARESQQTGLRHVAPGGPG